MPAVFKKPYRRLREKTWLDFELMPEEPERQKCIYLLAHREIDENGISQPQQSFLQEESLDPERSDSSKQINLDILLAFRCLDDSDMKSGLC